VSATAVETTRPRSGTAKTDSARRWIINSWVDSSLILLTPLLAIPAVLMLSSDIVGVQASTVSLIVTAFFATGHHLPGLIRAYGDRELFQRFKLRFLLAPPLVFLAYFPLYEYHFDLYRLIILVWATWHGFMQLYGFVRIYDAKVGSTARATANWDWLVCLCGFVTARLFRPEQVSYTLDHWYSAGGPVMSPGTVGALRWTALIACGVVLAGFTINYVVQWRRGPKPNPLKVAMLVSGIGTWWIAMCFVDELILGIAVFDICHDVQYLAIVWLYNCRRVNSNADLNGFMRYLFRRGMVLLYLGLITAYGAIGLVGPLVDNGTVSRFFFAVLFTSTILHYYYDGFIWRVREPVNQAGLGLTAGAVAKTSRWAAIGTHAHALKWGAAVVLLGLLFATDYQSPPLSTSRKDELSRTFTRTLVSRPILPQKEEEISWLYSRFQAAQDIAAAVPSDRQAQLQAAVMLANFGQNDEAVQRLEELLRRNPDYRDAHVALGDIQYYRGNFDQASEQYETALSQSKTALQRSPLNLKLGEIALNREDFAAAKDKFRAAVRDDPRLAASVEALEKGSPATGAP